MTIAPSPPFATVLRAYRLAAGLSQQALAERANLSLRAISDLERGRRLAPYPHTVKQLATALRLSSAERVNLEAASRPTPGAPVGVATEHGPVTNLPVQVTSFIGRHAELADIARLLTSTRLLTLTGSGGVGKTRLALQVAADRLADYPDGVWLVELAAVTDPTLVEATVASVLGLPETPGQAMGSRLVAVLRPKRLLLMLDNCEHVIEECARLIDALHRGCPDIRLLVSSREALRIDGEVTWRVPSLSLPDPAAPPEATAASEAVRLFVERATAVHARFSLTPDNAPAVLQICRRLDGIPLAIELAAARVRHLTVAQLAARLDDRLQLLTGGSRTALPRQQTLRATLDWSHDLLSEPEQAVFRRLAIFVGGCTLAAAEAVCAWSGVEAQGLAVGGWPSAIDSVDVADGGVLDLPSPTTDPRSPAPIDVLDLLTRLVDKSLVLVDEHGGEARFRLLETMRAYGRDRLTEAGEVAAAQRRHLDWCLALAVEAEPHLGSGEQLAWLAQLEAEHDNLRAALAWSLAHDPERGLYLAGTIWPFWRVQVHLMEGERWLDTLLARWPEPGLPRVKGLLGAALLARTQARLTVVKARLEECLPLCRALGDRRLLALTLRELGYLLPELGDLQRGEALLEEGLALVRADGDDNGLGITLFMLTAVAAQRGDHARVRELSDASLPLLRRTGDRWMIYRALNFMAIVALRAGDCARARALLEEAGVVIEELGSRGTKTLVHLRLGWCALWQGDTEQATAHYTACRSLAQRLETRTMLAHSLAGLGRVAQVRGECAQATTLLLEALAMYTERGVVQGIGEAQYGLGLAARDQGDLARATDWLQQSLAVRQTTDDRPGIATCLEGLATVAAMQGPAARTARLLGAAEALRQAIGSPMPLVERPAFEAAVQMARAAIGQASFEAAWAAGRALPLDTAIAEALAGIEVGAAARS